MNPFIFAAVAFLLLMSSGVLIAGILACLKSSAHAKRWNARAAKAQSVGERALCRAYARKAA